MVGESISSTTATGINVSDLVVEYDKGRPVLNRLQLEIEPGEIVALLGASGCGKSTFLRTIARLIRPSSGDITFAPQASNSQDLSYVFQDPTLLPWRTVVENVKLPLELGRDTSAPPSKRLEAILESVGLTKETYDQFPRQLSGGMKMRTSLARAIITDPSLLLLDEPFAALDDLLRTKMNELILQLWEQRKRTILFVTHNIAEAAFLSHRVAVFGKGVIAEILNNELPWPRQKSLRNSTEFAAFYGRVSHALAEAQS